MTGGRPHQINVVTVGRNSSVALLGSGGKGFRPAPRVDDDVFRHTGREDLIPSDHHLVVLADNLLYASREVGLQRGIIFESMRFHELLNFGVCVPLLAIDLVAADVKIVIGEKLCHFADKLLKEVVGVIACRIHRGIEYAPASLDLVGAGGACQVGITYEPRRAMTGHVEFRNYADTAVARISDYIADLCLRVEQSVRAHFL